MNQWLLFVTIVLLPSLGFAEENCDSSHLSPGVLTLEEVSVNLRNKMIRDCENISVHLTFPDTHRNSYSVDESKKINKLVTESLMQSCLRSNIMHEIAYAKGAANLTFCYDKKDFPDLTDKKPRGKVELVFDGRRTPARVQLIPCKVFYEEDKNSVSVKILSEEELAARNDVSDRRVQLGGDPISLSQGKLEGMSMEINLSGPNKWNESTHTGLVLDYSNTGNIHYGLAGWEYGHVTKSDTSETKLFFQGGAGGLVLPKKSSFAVGGVVKVGVDQKFCTDTTKPTSACLKMEVSGGTVISPESVGVFASGYGAASVQKKLSKQSKDFIFVDVGGRASAAAVTNQDSKGTLGAAAEVEVIPQTIIGIGF